MTDNAADFRGGERHAFTLAVPANFRARRRYDNELILVEVRPPADDLARLFLTDVDVADDEAVGLRVRADRDDAPDDDALDEIGGVCNLFHFDRLHRQIVCELFRSDALRQVGICANPVK